MAVILVLVISTMLNIAYFAPVTFQAFFGRSPDGVPGSTGIREAPVIMVVPIVAAAVLSLLAGIFPGVMMQFVGMVIS
jgi:multicomponent Na+:H+ antiporter subunit D